MRYTWLHETLSDDRSTTVAGTLSGGLAGNTALSVKAESERDFHIVDLLVPFACCNFCDYLSIRPYAGFRYLYLDSSYKEVNSGDNFTALALGGDTSTNNHEHHACGAALGFDFATCRSNTLGLDIGARGRLGMALLSSLTDQHQSIVRLGAITSDTRVLNEHKSYQVYELMIGIDADRCVCGRELNFGVDYEVSKWGREDESTTGAFPTIITQANRDRITIKSFIFHIGYCF